jgi:hypothetical protein
VNLEKLTRDDLILGGLAVLLVIGLLAFPWFTASLGLISISSSATGAPDGWLGVLALVAALLLIVDLMLERFSPQTEVPAFSGSRTMTRLALAGLAALFMLIKFLIHIHFTGVVTFGWGFYVDLVIVAALVFHALAVRNAGPAAAAPPPPSAPSAPVA